MKSRLTITLSEEILKRVDRLIDGKDIRNRSHAIEHLVRLNLSPYVRTAIILAGGKTDRKAPPPLTKINGQFLIWVTLEHLKKYKVEQVIIAAGSWEPTIRSIIVDGESVGLNVSYLSETQRLGTAGAIKKASPFLTEPFLVIHGDVLTTLNIEDFIRFHENEKTMATIAVKPRIAEKKYGKVLLQGNRITDFLEDRGDRGISIINTGVYLFE